MTKQKSFPYHFGSNHNIQIFSWNAKVKTCNMWHVFWRFHKHFFTCGTQVLKQSFQNKVWKFIKFEAFPPPLKHILKFFVVSLFFLWNNNLTSQCVFLLNAKFSSKVSKTLFNVHFEFFLTRAIYFVGYPLESSFLII